MGTFITGETEEVYADKSTAPGLVRPANWTDENVWLATNANDVKAALDDIRDQVLGMTLENLAPNSQWQVATGLSASPKYNKEGTGTETPISVSSYTTGSNSVVCTTAETGDLKVGDLVSFSAAAHSDMRITLALVTAVTNDTSFTVVLPIGKVGASSAACTATPQAVGGDTSLGTGNSFDGWGKTTTLKVWRDDHVINAISGSKYAQGAKKTVGTVEKIYCRLPANRVFELQGRPLSFGMKSRIKINTGASRRLYLLTDGTGGTTTYSAASSSSALAWQSVSLGAVPSDATIVEVGIELTGASGDVFHVACPMLAMTPYLPTNCYRQQRNEYLQPIVHSQMHSILNTSLQSSFGTSESDLQFQIRVYPETNGRIAPTVRSLLVKWEARCETINDAIGFSHNENAPHVYGPLLLSKVQLQQNGGMPVWNAIQTDGTWWCFVNLDVPPTGTLNFTNGSATVTGTGTAFLSELSSGMLIRSNAETSIISVLSGNPASDTSLTLTAPYSGTTHSSAAKKSRANWYNSSLEINGFLLS